jgi:HSP20 family protein
MMRRMLDDLDDLDTFGLTSTFGPFGPFGVTSPFSPMRRMLDSMERTFDTDLLGDVDLPVRDLVWAPRIEITQREDKLLVRADLPGVPQDQIQISAQGDSLVVEGERALPSDQQEDMWCSECAHGRFRRVIALPEGADPDKAEAHYKNGVLEVAVPVPVTQMRGRRIEIQRGANRQDQPNPQLEEGTAQEPQAQKH